MLPFFTRSVSPECHSMEAIHALVLAAFMLPSCCHLSYCFVSYFCFLVRPTRQACRAGRTPVARHHNTSQHVTSSTSQHITTCHLVATAPSFGWACRLLLLTSHHPCHFDSAPARCPQRRLCFTAQKLASFCRSSPVVFLPILPSPGAHVLLSRSSSSFFV